jgi:hypothetical protein
MLAPTGKAGESPSPPMGESDWLTIAPVLPLKMCQV